MIKYKSYPSSVKYIVNCEGAERFSYYGMRGILFVYMTQYLMMEANLAQTQYHLFLAACYFFPILGGIIADRLIGKYKTIIYFCMIYCLGHGVLALWETGTSLIWGLGLIAIGAGCIKPCVSTFLGDQFDESNQHLLSGVFSLFYWMINFAGFFSTLLTPWLLQRFGPGVAFGVPGGLMVLATLIFLMGSRHYRVKTFTRVKEPGFFHVFISAFRHRHQRKHGESFLDAAKRELSGKLVDDSKSIVKLAKIFILVSGFWALFDQMGSSWIGQAQQMNTTVMGVTFLPAQVYALQPVLLLILIPIFSRWIYPFFQR